MIDSTGLSSSHASQYYLWRRDPGGKRFPCGCWNKLTLVCDGRTHLWAAAVIGLGPSNDSPYFEPAITQACHHLHFDRLLADSAYDSEDHHAFCHQVLMIDEVILPARRSGHGKPRRPYRIRMREAFPVLLYRQRWQIESAISRLKRHLGQDLRARKPDSQERECLYRVLTHNLMILGDVA